LMPRHSTRYVPSCLRCYLRFERASSLSLATSRQTGSIRRWFIQPGYAVLAFDTDQAAEFAPIVGVKGVGLTSAFVSPGSLC
jgi:hypothetical protein